MSVLSAVVFLTHSDLLLRFMLCCFFMFFQSTYFLVSVIALDVKSYAGFYVIFTLRIFCMYDSVGYEEIWWTKPAASEVSPATMP